MKIKIRVFFQSESSIWYSELSFIDKFPLKIPDGNEIVFTDGEDYTHAVIMNTTMPILRRDIPKENVIGIALEPPGPPPFLGMSNTFIEYAKKYIGRYYIGDVGQLPPPFIGKFIFIEYCPPPREIPYNKPNLMSIMISHKGVAPGHKYRHILAIEILKRGLPIDIYGNGCRFYTINDSRIKGGFTWEDRLKMLLSYQFHIAIENFQVDHYFSEKIINPLLCNTTPVYLGCRNIDSYLGANSVKLNGEVEHDIRLIEDICMSPHKYRTNIDVCDVFNRVNLVNNMHKEGLLNHYSNKVKSTYDNMGINMNINITTPPTRSEIGHIQLKFTNI